MLVEPVEEFFAAFPIRLFALCVGDEQLGAALVWIREPSGGSFERAPMLFRSVREVGLHQSNDLSTLG